MIGGVAVVTPETLTAFPFFADLSETELKSMSIIANKVSFQRRELIFREDDPAHTLYLLLDGWVDVVVNTDAKGEQHELVTTLSPGDIFGWSALVDPYVYTGSAICASPVEAIEFKGADLLGMLKTSRKTRSRPWPPWPKKRGTSRESLSSTKATRQTNYISYSKAG
jgi:CRP-like cAMP-binding protein